MIEVVRYRDEDGREPFTLWLRSLRDAKAQARIYARIRQVESGNMGDTKSVGEGVTELRIHVGAGYRIYCGRRGECLIILLCGGDKSSQTKDVVQAKAFWVDWKGRQL